MVSNVEKDPKILFKSLASQSAILYFSKFMTTLNISINTDNAATESENLGEF